VLLPTHSGGGAATSIYLKRILRIAAAEDRFSFWKNRSNFSSVEKHKDLKKVIPFP
jgi:hypothetical protein